MKKPIGFNIFLFLFFAALLLSALVMEAVAQNHFSIVGKVVDGHEKPVSNAVVSVVSPVCKKCPDEIVPSYKTGSDGMFFINGEIKANKLRIVVERLPSIEVWSPVYPASVKLRRVLPLEGLSVVLPRSGATVQLGNIIRPHFEYKNVSIDLSKVFGTQAAILTPDSALRITIYHRHFRILRDLLVPESAIDRKRNRFVCALPVGHWVLHFRSSTGDRRITGTMRLAVK